MPFRSGLQTICHQYGQDLPESPKIGTMCVKFSFVRETPVEGGQPRIISIPAPEKAHVTASSFFTAVRPSGGVHAGASAGAIACS
jgi:hypothetical protein